MRYFRWLALLITLLRLQAAYSLHTSAEAVVRDYCGNSFHPDLIAAAIGDATDFQDWAFEVACCSDTDSSHLVIPSPVEVRKQYHCLPDGVMQKAKSRHHVPTTAGNNPMPDVAISQLQQLENCPMPPVTPTTGAKIATRATGVFVPTGDSVISTTLPIPCRDYLLRTNLEVVAYNSHWIDASSKTVHDLLGLFFHDKDGPSTRARDTLLPLLTPSPTAWEEVARNLFLILQQEPLQPQAPGVLVWIDTGNSGWMLYIGGPVLGGSPL